MSTPFKMKGFSGFGDGTKSPLAKKKKGETTTTTKKHTINTPHGGLPGDSQVIGSGGVQYDPKEVVIETTSTTPTINKKGRTTSTSSTTTNLLNPQTVHNYEQSGKGGNTTGLGGFTTNPAIVETTKTHTKLRKNNKKKKSISVTYNPDGTVKSDKVQVTKYDKKGNVKKIVNKKATKRRVKRAGK